MRIWFVCLEDTGLPGIWLYVGRGPIRSWSLAWLPIIHVAILGMGRHNRPHYHYFFFNLKDKKSLLTTYPPPSYSLNM